MLCYQFNFHSHLEARDSNLYYITNKSLMKSENFLLFTSFAKFLPNKHSVVYAGV